MPTSLQRGKADFGVYGVIPWQYIDNNQYIAMFKIGKAHSVKYGLNNSNKKILIE